MTIIPKKQWKGNEILQYELTPFRKEMGYQDKRHPDIIERSDDIIEDAKRREFTISCLYYFSKDNNSKPLQKSREYDSDKLKKDLNTHGFVYLRDLSLWIIQDEHIIKGLFPKWKFKAQAFERLINKQAKLYHENKAHPQSTNIIIDPFKWIHDLIDGKLKAVWNPDQRFWEDALRLIRALRFVNVINQKLKDQNISQHSIDFERETRKSIQKNFSLIQYMAKERIKLELDKVFRKWNPFGFIALLDEVNMLKYLFPAIYALKHVDQPVRYHPFDVYHHTLMTVFELQKINKNPLVRWAMLYHDVGKPDQYYIYRLGLSREEIQSMHYLNHRNTSGNIADQELQSLKFSKKEREEIVRYIDHHHKPEEIIAAKPENREKKLRKLLSEAGIERMRNLFDVVLWDRLGHYNPIQAPEIEIIYDLKSLTEKLYSTEGQFTIKDLAVNGEVLMKQFKLSPSPQVWELLQKAFDWTIQDIKNRNTKTKILTFLNSI